MSLTEKICIKRGVQWVESDHNLALFYLYGSRIAIQGKFVETILEDLFQFLQLPRSVQEMEDRFQAEDAFSLRECISALKKAGLVYLFEEAKVDSAGENPKNENLLHFLGNFLPSKVSAEVTAQELRSRSVTIVNHSTLLPDLLTSLRDLDLKSVRVLDPSRCNESDIENYPKLFSPKDIGRPKLQCLKDNGFLFDVSATILNEDDVTNSDLIVVVANWFSLKDLKKWNRRFLRENKRWLLVIQDFFGGSIGPWFGLPDGACFECLLARRAMSFPSYDKHKVYENFFETNPEKFRPNFNLFSRQLADSMSIEVLKLLLTPLKLDALQGIYEFDFLNHRTEFHPVLALPTCEACGPAWNDPTVNLSSLA